MATIDISRNHSLGIETARERAEELAKELETKLGITWRWDGGDIRFDAKSGAAKGASGKVGVTASKVRVEIDLPFLLRAMKGAIAAKVESKLDRLVS